MKRDPREYHYQSGAKHETSASAPCNSGKVREKSLPRSRLHPRELSRVETGGTKQALQSEQL